MSSYTQIEQRIERLDDAFRTYGYRIVAEPIFGQEELFAHELQLALSRIGLAFDHNAKLYGYRGKSKRALAALHQKFPEPGFGIEVMK